MFDLFSFTVYVISTAFTPGPNNIMSMSNGSRLGFKKALPFNFGILAGETVLFALCTLFCNSLSELIPAIQKPMVYIGAAYMLYLAWGTYKSDDVTESEDVKSGFFRRVMLQFINPKAYIYCIVSMQAYILPFYSGNIPALLAFSMLLTFICFVSTVLWNGFGSVFKVLFSKHKKFVNTFMALLLVYCAVTLVIH